MNLPPRLHAQWFENLLDYALPLYPKTSIFPPKSKQKPSSPIPSLKSISTNLNQKERALSDCRWARTCNPKLVCGYLGRIPLLQPEGQPE